MTKDRLKELQKSNPWPRVSYKKLIRQRRQSHELGSLSNEEAIPFTNIHLSHENDIDEFLAKIDLIQKFLGKLAELVKDVEDIHKKMLDPMADSKLRDELNQKTDSIKALSYDISKKLKALEEAQRIPADAKTVQQRMRESQIFYLTKNLRDIMNQYNQEFCLHRERCKRSIQRELEISGNRRTDEEIEEMLETGFPGKFSFTIMIDIEKAKQAATFIEERHRDIQKIEQTIKELHNMFLDLATLVETQGQMIDIIEVNVQQAADFVSNGTKDIKDTQKNNQAARKKKIIICAILTALGIILFLVLIAYIVGQWKSIG